MEVAPGILRIGSVLGPRPFSQYLIRDERSLLVDTGVATTPAEVILPFFRDLGLDPAALDFVVVSHADVDHFGGNEVMRAAALKAVFCAHAADVAWIQDRELILRERYGWYEAYGIGYDADTSAWLRDAMGADVPLDLELTGGERFRLGPHVTVEVLHLPGHSPGHVGLWEPESRTAIVQDAVMAAGLLDTKGNVIHPPPIVDATGYEHSVRLLQELRPARLLTAHYAVIEGVEVERFLAASLRFLEAARVAVMRALDGDPDLTLKELLAQGDADLGPFTSMPNELAATLRGVLQEQGLEVRA